MEPLPRAVELWRDPEALIEEWETYPRKHRHEALVADWVGEVDTVADLGCGSARYARVLDCTTYLGFDNSSMMLALAGANVMGLDIFEGPLVPTAYDVVIAVDVFFHLSDPIEAATYIVESWDAERYVFSLAVGDFREDLYLSTVIPFSEFLTFLGEIKLTRLHIERYVEERFAWALLEVSRESTD